MKKHIPVLLYICCNILAVLVIPINLFFIELPEWIAFIFLIISVILLSILYKQNKTKPYKKIVLLVTSLLTYLIILFGTYCNPFWNCVTLRSSEYSKPLDSVITYEEANEDLTYTLKYLGKVHPLFQNGLSNETLDTYNQSLNTLSSSNEITTLQLYREIQKLLNNTPDAHTTVYSNDEDDFILENYVSRAKLGEQLTEINNIPLEQFLTDHPSQVKYDEGSNGVYALKHSLKYLSNIKVIGLDPISGFCFTYKLNDNSYETVNYSMKDFISCEEYKDKQNTLKPGSSEFVYYEINDDNKTAVLTLNKCINNDKYKSCINNLFHEVKEKSINNIAIDLRNNGGGSSYVANEFFRYLDIDKYTLDKEYMRLGFISPQVQKTTETNKRYSDLLFHGNLYVLTSYNTFSAATDFAKYIKDNHLGLIIGETSGNDPNGYGEVVTFQLPNSKLCVQISAAKFERINAASNDKFLKPDIPCDRNDVFTELFKQIK